MKTYRFLGHEISIDNFSDHDGQPRYCVAIDDDVDILQDDFVTEASAIAMAKKLIESMVEDSMWGCRRDGR